LHVGLDGQVAETSDNLTGFTTDEWSWSRLTLDSSNARLALNSSGTYTLGLFMREDGIRVDKLLLITDTNYIPTGMGPAESQQTVITPSTNLSDVTYITYEYDPLYRLTGTVYTGAITATYVYTYDAAGNMSEYVETIAEDTSSIGRSFNPANQLITSTNGINTTSYVYDDNGNLTVINQLEINPLIVESYEYDQRNLLTGMLRQIGHLPTVPVAGYVYDGAGNRVQQLVYDGSQLAQTITYTNDIQGLTQVLVSDNGVTTTHMLFGQDLILQDDGQTRTLLADGLGSTRTEMVGSQVETTATYEPYGKLLAQTGPSGTVYGYTGEAHDASTGLVFLRARYYNPDLKLFLSRDPYSGSMGRPSTLHGYSYVENDPINGTDPSGLCRQVGDEACWSLAEQKARQAAQLLGYQQLSQGQFESLLEAFGPKTEAQLRGLSDSELRNIALNALCLTAQCIYSQSTGYYDPSAYGQMPSWPHDAPYLETKEFTTFIDKITPDALVLGKSASITFSPGPLKYIPFLNRLSFSGICGVDVLISLNELPSIFVYGGGSAGANKVRRIRSGVSGNIAPRYGGLVWELDGHQNYRGLYETLSIDAGAGVGVEANLFRSPDAIPFNDDAPGSWGFTLGPNAGGGGSVAYNETCYVEITSTEFLGNLFARDFASITSDCR
jgi:RHS repeat-associated protein